MQNCITQNRQIRVLKTNKHYLKLNRYTKYYSFNVNNNVNLKNKIIGENI